MFRTTSFTTVCLILAFANSADAQKPFKNKIGLAAKKSYDEAIAKAKKEYAAKLDIAIKDAGGAGDLEEANQLVAEKKRIEGNDPPTVLRRRLTGTKWMTNPKAPKLLLRFETNNVGTYSNGIRFAWFVTFKNTVVFQNRQNLEIFVWHFDDKVKTARLFSFRKAKPVPGGRRVR